MHKKIICAALWTVTVTYGPAIAQEYPTKPIRYIVPFGAGGPTDTQARWVAQKLNAAFGQTVIVDNRPAAGGVPGTAAVAKAAPDGYTLLAGNPGPLTVAPAISLNVPYDTLRDFTPVTLVAKSPSVLIVHPALPAKTSGSSSRSPKRVRVNSTTARRGWAPSAIFRPRLSRISPASMSCTCPIRAV